MLRMGRGVVSSACTALGIGGGSMGSRADSSSTSCRHRLALCLRGRDALNETARPPPKPGGGEVAGDWFAGGSASGILMCEGRDVLMIGENEGE
jgi:hypothetical protein